MIRVRGLWFAACAGRGSGWLAGGLVVAAGVEDELAPSLAADHTSILASAGHAGGGKVHR
jgi:hypothetical protein